MPCRTLFIPKRPGGCLWRLLADNEILSVEQRPLQALEFPIVPCNTVRMVAPQTTAHRIGQLVQRRRSELGMDQSDLVKAAGVDPKTVRGLEKGTRWPRDASLFRIEVALGLEPGTIKLWRAYPDELAEAESAELKQSDPASVAEKFRSDIVYLAKVVASLSTALNNAAKHYPDLKEVADYSNEHTRTALIMALADAHDEEADVLFPMVRTWIGAQDRPPRADLSPDQEEYIEEMLRVARRSMGEEVDEPPKRSKREQPKSLPAPDADTLNELQFAIMKPPNVPPTETGR